MKKIPVVNIKITGVMVDILVGITPSTYKQYVIHDGNTKILYLQVIRALYGMLVAAMLWYKRFKKDLEEIGSVFNPYDPCVAT